MKFGVLLHGLWPLAVLSCHSAEPSSAGGGDAGSTPPADAGRGPKVSGPIVSGIALLVHWNVDLEWLDQGAGSLAAVVLGTASPEVLEAAGEGYTATRVLAPGPWQNACPVPFPTAVTVFDLDLDGGRDLAIFDPGCGNWLSRSGPDERMPVEWSAALPELPPHHYLGTLGGMRSGEVTRGLYAAWNHGLTGIVQIGDTWVRSPELGWTLPAAKVACCTDILVPLAGPNGAPVLLQRGHQLQTFTFGDDGGLLQGDIVQQVPGSHYVKPFDAFDHLKPFPSCGTALGVGTFASQARVPRQLQLLGLSDGELRTIELETPFEVVSYSTVTQDDGTVTIGFLGRDDGRVFFAAAVLSGCRGLTELRFAPGDVELQTIHADLRKEKRLDLTDGVKLLGRMNSVGEPEFVCYDGFAVHRLLAGPSELQYERIEVHEKRDDLIWSGQ